MTDSTDISDMDIDEGEAPENNSLIYKLKSKIQSLQKKGKKSSDDELEDGEDADADDEAAKKKKRSKILQGVIVGGIVIFLASDYIFPPDEEVPEVKLKPRPKPVKKPVTETNPAGTDTPAETPVAETPSETPAETPAAETPATETPATETPDDSSVDVTSVETPTDAPDDSSDSIDTSFDTPATTETSDTNTDFGLGEPGESDPGAVTSNDSVDGNQDILGSEDNLTDQILEDLEKQAKKTEPAQTRKQYVAPPDYEYRGRGLVYNCTGKHWACVDAPSYKTCEDNSSSVKYLNKTTECYPFNVYETAKGCESMQNRMVSSSAKTNFCSE